MMSAALGKALCLATESFLKETSVLTNLGLKASRRNPICSVGNPVLSCQRHYRSCPSHGIGRFRHLLPPQDPKVGKKSFVQMKPIVPGTDHSYGSLNVVMTGCDMTVVEHYAQYVHKFCNRMSIKVEECYAMPTKTMEVFVSKAERSKSQMDSVLTTHQRVVRISGLSATLAPIFLEILQTNQPEGVHLLVKEYTEEDFQVRLKSRPELEELRSKMK
uniref:Large ribosomal subunit protein mL48 n=1 Tax=Pogona vitticeps TaxID=103695 RepID=A0ABM5FVU3_9SAUR